MFDFLVQTSSGKSQCLCYWSRVEHDKYEDFSFIFGVSFFRYLLAFWSCICFQLGLFFIFTSSPSFFPVSSTWQAYRTPQPPTLHSLHHSLGSLFTLIHIHFHILCFAAAIPCPKPASLLFLILYLPVPSVHFLPLKGLTALIPALFYFFVGLPLLQPMWSSDWLGLESMHTWVLHLKLEVIHLTVSYLICHWNNAFGRVNKTTGEEKWEKTDSR